MRNYKCLIFILCFMYNTGYAQKGFAVIRKAETKFAKGKYNSAMRLLKKAGNMNYGMCGNTWSEAEVSINILKSQIYIEKKEFDKAIHCLDECVELSGFTGDRSESLNKYRLKAYKEQIGAESFKRLFENALPNAEVICDDDLVDCEMILNLSNDMVISKILLTIRCKDFFEIVEIDNERERLERWIAAFKETQEYQLAIE